MDIQQIYTTEELHQLAQARFKEERDSKRLDGWFIIKEITKDCSCKYKNMPPVIQTAETMMEIARCIPISISKYAVFAGTQNDAFARSYALINPTFKVNSFTGYCDPTAVFNDIEPNETFTQERIDSLREYEKSTPFAKKLTQAYDIAGDSTSEAVFFIEQVTGHLIPDLKTAISEGIEQLISRINEKLAKTSDQSKENFYKAMKIELEAFVILADRYAICADEMIRTEENEQRRLALVLMEETLRRVPRKGARNLYEAIQLFLLLWQFMCMEQAPNPFAFSVGNADRIFEPFRSMNNLNREYSAGLFKHFLVFFNVGDRSWAISQNIIIGGKSNDGRDLTNISSYALLDAYYAMNLPQPILSVKLHKNTPEELYESLGRFFFSPGVLTPSLFNDDSIFEVLLKSGIEKEDLENYSVAGCQEPLIMGKDNGNTTNSWLNLGKILELTINGGVSSISGKQMGLNYRELGLENENGQTILAHLRKTFYKHVDYFIDKMVAAANEASRAIALLPVPFLSAFMGGIESGIDLRDSERQGTKYNGSGCLIHGLSIVADSFTSIDYFLKERPEDSGKLIKALKTDFQQDEELRQYLIQSPKYGNGIENVDKEAGEIAKRISEMISSKKNYLKNSFRPDFSTPSTHLIYGYWVGATPDGRKSREMLGYGIDPLYGEAQSGMGFRVLSNMKLPFKNMNGGYASHFGINPNYFQGKSFETKGIEFRDKIIRPLFFNKMNKNISPFYFYVNVTTPDILRKVLEDPKKYAPSGVYIMRIHGTFVNFLDLSPEIQQDIIKRLDPKSTAMSNK